MMSRHNTPHGRKHKSNSRIHHRKNLNEPHLDLVSQKSFHRSHQSRHRNITVCDGCHRPYIDSFYYQCEECQDYELCYFCAHQNVTTGFHTIDHRMLLLSNKTMPIIDIHELEFGKELGHGAFGIAYKAYWPSRKLTVACKVITVPVDIFTHTREKSFFKEVAAYSQLVDPNILKIYGYSQRLLENGTREYVLVMEFMDKGSLNSLLYKTKEKLSLRKKLSLACDVASGMKKIHDYRMIHRDIRPDNILVKENYTAKIGDMGIARAMDSNQPLTVIGCIPYMPLEFYTGTYDQKLDIFTFGLTLNELFTEISHNNKNRRISITKQSPVFRHLIAECINDDPKRRPIANNIVIRLQRFRNALNKLIKRTKEYPALSEERKNQILIDLYKKTHW
ncbi:unnamed protein product [Didymodactylos carnosus]|uniref:Protein kinase domain-containing protein n=1 Tax=Didymodactylos carnosus TaxID=1234261 RepID=A0A814U261_9BILA|nr:unnamed protein product [Didymodactylos carnosus]CAF1170456.1 unnamed protein product [Didymodactylos carnosus]CAF3934180.1 unnamed protein product [Didymodactylos carnosus]CAF3951695.1 unnamed protein product [Didymodactylos carnosus]